MQQVRNGANVRSRRLVGACSSGELITIKSDEDATLEGAQAYYLHQVSELSAKERVAERKVLLEKLDAIDTEELEAAESPRTATKGRGR